MWSSYLSAVSCSFTSVDSARREMGLSCRSPSASAAAQDGEVVRNEGPVGV